MDEKLVFEALRRGLITPEEAKSKLQPEKAAMPMKADDGFGDIPPSASAPNTSSDVAKSFASGVGRGLPNAIDFAGAAVAKGADFILDKTGAGNALGLKTGIPFSEYASGGGINTAVDAAVGPRYVPQTTAGQYANAAGQGVAGAVLAPVSGASLLGTAAKTALTGAGSGLGGQFGGDVGDVIGGDTGRIIGSIPGALIGGNPAAAARGLGKAATATGSAAVRAAAPSIDDATARLAKRAEEFGIPVSTQQIAPTKIRNTAQKVSAAVPFSGVQKFEDTQRAAFNKALAGTIGETSDNIGPDTIKNYLNRSSEGFDGVLKGQAVNVGEDSVKTLDNLVANAQDSVTGDLADIVRRNVDKLKADITDGVISGEKLASYRSQLVKRAANAQAGAKEFLGDLVDEIDDLAEKGLGQEAVDQLKQLRREYRNYKTVEPLLEKATDGMINPTDLQQRVASSKFIRSSRMGVGDDDLVDLARIGKQLLVKQGGSDTFEKASLLGQGAGGLAAVTNPVLGLKLLGGVALNRAFQSFYNQSPKVVNAAIEKALDKGSTEAINLLKKKAPLDVVAKAAKKAGATDAQVNQAMQEIQKFSVQGNNNLPATGKITRQPSKKTGS